MAQTPPSNGRASDIRIWVVSGFFLILLIAAGVLLVLYFALPESEVTVWFPSIAMIFVGIPWAFWIMTCFYRYMTGRGLPEMISTVRQPNKITTSIAPAPSSKTSKTNSAGNNNIESPVKSPAGSCSARNNNIAHNPVSAAAKKVDSNANNRSSGSDATYERTNSSLASHESETPLALSM